MKSFMCLSCRREKPIEQKAKRKGQPKCKTCVAAAAARSTTGHSEGHYRRAQLRYLKGAVPPWALS